MELLDIYREDRNKTGRTAPRGTPRPPGDLQLVIHVCFFDSGGKMPIQRRSHRKDLFPGLWDISVAGSVLHGEDSHSAAQREVREELGYFPDLSGMRPSMTINFDLGFDDIYPIARDLKLFSLHLQKDEVEEVM